MLVAPLSFTFLTKRVEERSLLHFHGPQLRNIVFCKCASFFELVTVLSPLKYRLLSPLLLPACSFFEPECFYLDDCLALTIGKIQMSKKQEKG